MATKTRRFDIADLFCGAGGSSTGAEKAIEAIGGCMNLVCVNHWPVAIATHKKNHPTAKHYIEDLAVADPNDCVPGGKLDLLMASPECRFYSRARGGKPVHDQARMNPWVILKWLTALDVKNLLVENVPEFVNWGPLLKSGLPDSKRKGQYFQGWFNAIKELGYQVEYRMLNAADFGDATTRRRFFLIARKGKKRIVWPEPTHSVNGEKTLFGQLPKWKPAKDIIDWDFPGRSLIDDPKYKKKPLSIKTRQRIAKGLEKYGGPLSYLFINLLDIEANGSTTGKTIEAFIMGKQGNATYRSTDQPIQSVTTMASPLLISPTVIPFVMGKQGHSPAYRSTNEPVPAVTCESRSLLIEPIITARYDDLTAPMIVKYYNTGVCHPIDEPLPTITTKDRIGLANPVIIPFRGERPGEDPRCHDIEDPVPSITTKPGFSLASPVLIEVNHNGDRTGKSMDEPLGTVTTKRGTAIVEPTIEQGDSLMNIDPRRLVVINDQLYILDIRFRMLSNIELARAMGFTDNETTYEFIGNSTEITRQIGNAVPVNLAKSLVMAILSN